MAKRPQRNEPCHCGSGKKFKNCCQGKRNTLFMSKLGIAGIVIAVIFGILIAVMLLTGGGTPDCPPGTTWSSAHQHCH